MRLKWILATVTCALAAAMEAFMTAVLFGAYNEVSDDPYAWVLIMMSVALIVAISNNLFMIYSIVRYNNTERVFKKTIDYIYTGFVIFSILFIAALSYGIFKAWSTGFGANRELTSQDRLGLNVLIFFCLLCLWNLIVQIQFRRYIKKKQRDDLNDLINDIGQTMP